MRRLLLVLVAILVLALGAALVAPALIPEATLRARAEQAASEALGREVGLAGDISLRLLPRLEIRATDASVANAPGFSAAPFAEMAELRLGLALWPLVSRRIELTEFALIDPVIRLEQRGGANNWTFARADAPAAPAPEAAGEAGFRRQPGALPIEASLGDVRLENGTILYAADGQERRIEGLDVFVALPGVDAPARVDGVFSADGSPMRFEANLGSPRAVFEGAETPFDLSVTGALADIAFDGRILAGEAFAFDGQAEITLPLRALARYLGADLPDGDVFKTFTADGALAGAPGRVTFTGAQIGFDAISALGDLTLDYDRARPLLTGALAAALIDITPYIPAEPGSPEARSGEGIGPWSEASVDLSPLSTLDADLAIRAERFVAREIEASDIAIAARLRQGLLTLDLSEFGLYGGSGQARAVVDASRGIPVYSFQARIDALDALPFLTAAAGFDRLRGLGAIDLDVTGTGLSPAAVMGSLTGEGRFNFADGAIVGANLAQVIRTVQQAVETGSLPQGFAETAETDFTALGGTVTISNGVARNLDLAMLSPLLRVQGEGAVDLAAQAIDYRLTPRAVGELTGQGGDLNLQGLAVPVRIRGGFNAVDVSIDYDQVARDLIRARAGTLVGGDVGAALSDGRSPEDIAREAAARALRDALGGEAGQTEGESGEDAAARLLRGFLAGRREPASEQPPAEEPAAEDPPSDAGGDSGGDSGGGSGGGR